MIGPNGMNAACKIAVVTCSSRPPARDRKDRDEVRRWRTAGRDSWIDAGGFLGVQAVGGLLTHVERRLGLRHRPLSCSLRCPDCGGRGTGRPRCSKKLDWPVARMVARQAGRTVSREEKATSPFRRITLTRRRPIRRRTHGRWRCLPSGEWPGPRRSALSRVRDHPRRATRLALPTEPFSPFRLNVGSRSPPRPSVPRTGWLPASVSAPWRPRARVSPLRAPALWSSARRSPPPRPSWSSAKVRTAPAPR